MIRHTYCSRKLNTDALARVQISLYKPECSGDGLIEICKWVSECGFQTLELQIADSLQRFNIMWRKQVSEKEAEIMALRDGDAWLNNNSNTIKLLAKKFTKFSVTRWNHWISHKLYIDTRNKIQIIFDTDHLFSALIESEIRKYFSNCDRNLDDFRIKQSREFLLEEISVSELSACIDSSYEIYPGPRFSPEEYLAAKDSLYALHLNSVGFVHVEMDN